MLDQGAVGWLSKSALHRSGAGRKRDVTSSESPRMILSSSLWAMLCRLSSVAACQTFETVSQRRQGSTGPRSAQAAQLSRQAISSGMPKRDRVYVYSGPGAGDRSILSAVEALKGSVPTGILVCTLRLPRLAETQPLARWHAFAMKIEPLLAGRPAHARAFA